MTQWYLAGLEDDLRPRMFALAHADDAFALATIVAADGGPRPVGAQMVITPKESWGFLSGGCIEADVTHHARAVLADGAPRRLIYGHGSPFIDIRLPCGGCIEVLVEAIKPDDPAIQILCQLYERRRPAVWNSDGEQRSCEEWRADESIDALVFPPQQRLVVVGHDPFALSIASLGTTLGWQVLLVHPSGPQAGPPFNFEYSREQPAQAFSSTPPDRWTAIAVATHDLEHDQDALAAALRSDAGYVGVLGARRRLKDRRAGLRAAGLDTHAIERLRAPIGLAIGAATPWEVGIAVMADIIANRRLLPLTSPLAGLRSEYAGDADLPATLSD